MEDITNHIKNQVDKRVVEYVPTVIIAELDEIKHMMECFNNRKINYKAVFDSIYFTTKRTFDEFFKCWEEGLEAPGLRFFFTSNEGYVCIDNSTDGFFVEVYESLDKAILFLASPVCLETLYSGTLDDCLSEIEDS